MTERIIFSEEFEITRHEASMDRAVDEAQRHAWALVGVGSDGYSASLPEWERSRCGITVAFQGLESHYYMCGGSHTYHFYVEATKVYDEEDE